MKPTTQDDGDPPEQRHLELAADDSRRTAAWRSARLCSATLVLPVRMTERPSVEAGEREQGCQRDDEGRHLGADHQEPVDEADGQPEAERREDADDDRQPVMPEMMAMVIELAGTIEPTERSRCPAIISRPTGSAMMPSSAATLSQLAAPPADSEIGAAEDREEDQHGDQCRSASPTSGRRTRLPIESIDDAACDGRCRGGLVMGWMSSKGPWLVHGTVAPSKLRGDGDVRPSDECLGPDIATCA